MNLVAISPNILINPSAITCIEQRLVGNNMVTFVYLGEKEFALTYPIEDFYKNLGIADQSSGGQYFGG